MPFNRRVNRREFTQLSVAAGAMTVVHGSSAAARFDDMPIIDTHQHLWDLVQFQPPWLAGADAKIAAKHDTNDYRAETEGLNVVKAVYMEVDVAPADQIKEAEYVLALIQAGKTPTVGAVISGRPNSEQFAKYVAKFKDEPRIKGIRQVLQVDSAPRGLCLQPTFVRSMQLLGEMGKSFDLCMRPTDLADGAQLAEKCPDTRFIVDHCGNADPQAWRPKDRQTQKPSHEVNAWKRDMERLAKLENVDCKISGIIARAPQDWSVDDLVPAINFCLDTFGPDRVVFGGDWPVCKLGATYVEWVTALKQIVSSRPVADQKKLFHDNAGRVYRV
ncbi:MAG: amidohydrolase family protein [Pirellulaceae bacterium]